MKILIQRINKIYSTLYYKMLLNIFYKYSNHKYWQIIKFVYNVLMAKNIWYDKIESNKMKLYSVETDKTELTKKFDDNYLKMKRDFQIMHNKLSSRLLDKNLKYKIQFIIKSKTIISENDEVFDVNKKIFYIKIDNHHFPIDFVNKFREALTISMAIYLKNRNTFKEYETTKGKKIYLEIFEIKDFLKCYGFLDKINARKKYIKTKKYLKRKFGKVETIITDDRIWEIALTYKEVVMLIEKLHHKKYDFSQEQLTFEDLLMKSS